VLLAEDLLLLVTDDDSGKLSVSMEQVDLGLGGATLVELTLMDRVDLSREGDPGKPGRIVVRDASPTGDAVLDAALAILVERQGKKPSAVITPLSRHLRRTLYERLADSGVIRAEEDRILGVFPSHTWPTQDPRHEAGVRGLVTDALVHQATPDTRTAALIALIHALRCEHKIVDPGQYDLSKPQLRARAAEIATGSWASEAVRRVIDELIAAVVVAVSSVVVSSGAD
jgi:Golgi phosphoprotein 3 (GPP34)